MLPLETASNFEAARSPPITLEQYVFFLTSIDIRFFFIRDQSISNDIFGIGNDLFLGDFLLDNLFQGIFLITFSFKGFF